VACTRASHEFVQIYKNDTMRSRDQIEWDEAECRNWTVKKRERERERGGGEGEGEFE